MSKKWVAIHIVLVLLVAVFLSGPVSAAGTAESAVPTLNVRSGPGLSYSKVGNLAQGEDMTVISESGDWYEISSGSTKGWVASWLTKPVSASNSGGSQSGTAVATVDRLNVRSQPNLSGNVLAKMNAGETATVRSTAGDWVEIEFRGVRGFVSKQYITLKTTAQTQPKPAAPAANDSVFTVSANNLNVRAGANLSAKQIGQVHKGQSFNVNSVQGDWVNIQLAGGGNGWVYKQHGSLSGSKPAQMAASSGKTVTVLQNRTNLRSQPATSGAVVQQLNAGTVLNVTGESNSWYEVQLSNGTKAWIAGWVVSPSDGDKISAPAAQRQSGSLAGLSIVIDPGHGGKDGGTVGYYQTLEKDLTLKTAELLAANLRSAGAEVTMTRTSDQYVTLRNRISIGHQLGADAFISLHYDSSRDRSVNGFTTYFLHGYQQQLAQYVNDGLDGQVAVRARGVRSGNYLVLRENRQAAILVELGFLSNPNEEQFVSTDQYRRQAAYGIYIGLVNYFN